MLQLKSVTNLKTLLKVRRLYLDAFPGFERLPFWVLLYKAKKSDSKLSAIYNGDQFVGLTNVAYYQDIVYLFYLAIDPTLRSHGYGSKILHLLKENYPEKRIFLNIEKIDEMSDNFAQRVKRKKFYQQNGFQNADFEVETDAVTYEILYTGGPVARQDYDLLFKSYLHPIIRKLFL